MIGGSMRAALFLGAEHHDRIEPEDVDVDRRGAGHAGAGFGDRRAS